jgi:hypothetical protein
VRVADARPDQVMVLAEPRKVIDPLGEDRVRLLWVDRSSADRAGRVRLSLMLRV